MRPIQAVVLCLSVASCKAGASKSNDTDGADTDVVDTDSSSGDTDLTTTCLSSASRDPSDGLDAAELCPGDLVITELHAEPQDCGGNTAMGQYLEVFNASGATVHLASGLQIDVGTHPTADVDSLGDSDVEVGAQFIVRPLQYAAYCHDSPANFLLSAVSIPLEKTAIRLHNGVETMDSVDFTGWSSTPGTALELRIGALPPTADANDSREQWCDAAAAMLPEGSTDHGSPGAPNACAP